MNSPSSVQRDADENASTHGRSEYCHQLGSYSALDIDPDGLNSLSNLPQAARALLL